MKIFFGCLAVINMAATVWMFVYYPQFYDWSWLLLDAAAIFLAILPWLAAKES